MFIKRFASAVAVIGLAATACTTADEDSSSTPVTDLDPSEIVLTSALDTVDDCDALLGRIKDEAVERVGPYGFDQGGPIILEEAAAEAETALPADEAAGDAGSPAPSTTPANGRFDGDGQEFSTTNTQERDVDEADLVKTDGRRLVTVSGNRIRVIDVERRTPELVTTIKLPDEFWGGELFLNGDTALLMTSGWTDVPFLESGIASDWYPGSPTGRIMEIDLERGSIDRTLEFEGGYLSAREVDGSIRIVMSAAGNRFDFVYPSNPGAEEAAERANRELIESSTIDMWIPTFRIVEDGQTVREGPIVDCDRVYLPAEFAGFGSLVVLTVDIEDGLTINDSLSVFTDGQTVYASTERLAVATPRWPEFDREGRPIGDDDYRTAIHTFDISEPDRTEYAASGSVRGFLLNQYSLSEYDGYLRVATTDGTPWDSRESESFVTVLREDGRELRPVGQVGNLGRGEQIFAVRFLGDKGYVVTFEQIDPLYTLDLRDPENPTVEGELKIPGFSSYLHPYGDYLIGVGTDGDEEGRTQGAVVSMFDVSDPSDPVRVDKLSLGPTAIDDHEFVDSYTPVSGDARAFNIWDDVAIVPVGWWSYVERPGSFEERNGSSAVLIRLGGDGRLTRIGAVSHPVVEECEGPIPIEREVVEGEVGVELEGGSSTGAGLDPDAPDSESTDAESTDAEAEFVRPPDDGDEIVVEPRPSLPEPEFCFRFQPQINRSVVIGDNLYTISDHGVAVNDFDGLATVTWIPFER